MCVTDPSIKSRAACESAFDAFGAPKPRGPDVWDAPCTADIQCPFYRSNGKYANHRGGCDAGYCEMPLGVERAGYRKIAKLQPLCHGCGPEPEAQATCCAGQMPDPDYAFSLDEFQHYAPATQKGRA